MVTLSACMHHTFHRVLNSNILTATWTMLNALLKENKQFFKQIYCMLQVAHFVYIQYTYAIGICTHINACNSHKVLSILLAPIEKKTYMYMYHGYEFKTQAKLKWKAYNFGFWDMFSLFVGIRVIKLFTRKCILSVQQVEDIYITISNLQRPYKVLVLYRATTKMTGNSSSSWFLY